MRKYYFLPLLILFLCSHDLYLKMETYFLQPNEEATLSLYNGTFDKSENIITRDRMLDASVTSNGKRTKIQDNQWKDQDSTITQFTLQVGKPGTYVAGVSTKARNIELTAEKFNDYLKHDGVLDMLEARKEKNLLDQDAVESYQKHVKAIYQVGDNKTDDWKTNLGYPIEFIPQANPYETYSGEQLEVQLLLDGKPLSNQLVFAHHQSGSHGHTHDDEDHTHDGKSDEDHSHTGGQQLRTNDRGMVTVDLSNDGIYYLRTIHMVEVEDNDDLTHESKWATLTFEITHKHGADTHTHDHHHEEGIPTWVFILGSLIVIGLLFFVFRKKN